MEYWKLKGMMFAVARLLYNIPLKGKHHRNPKVACWNRKASKAVIQTQIRTKRRLVALHSAILLLIWLA
jgi:hypothetical protein